MPEIPHPKMADLARRNLAGADLQADSETYQSPINYEVRSVAKVWDIVSKGTHTYNEAIGDLLAMGPAVGNLGNKEPQIRFVGGHLGVKLKLEPPTGYFKNQPDATTLGQTLSRVLNEDIQVDGTNIYVNTEQGRSKLASFKDGFLYEPSDFEVTDQTNFEQHLRIALEMYRVIATEMFKVNQMTTPYDRVIIRPPARDYEQSSKYTSGRFKEGQPGKNGTEDLESLIIRDTGGITFGEIGGQPVAVATAERFAQILKFPEAYELWDSKPPRGILFFGPPGTGKTLLAKALATEADANFIYMKSSDIAGEGLVGQMESATAKIFDMAAELAEREGKHSIIFIDEADLLLPANTGARNRHEATGKVVGVFAEKMNGLKDNPRITVIASTNDPRDLDQKILSRMTEQIHVPLPDQDGLRDIFTIHIKKKEKNTGRVLFDPEIDLDQVSRIAHEQGMSGRDIEDVLTIIMAEKGQQQLNLIISAIQSGGLNIGQEANREVVAAVVTSLRNGETTYENLVVQPVTTEEIVTKLRQSKVLLQTKRRKPMGFAPDNE